MRLGTRILVFAGVLGALGATGVPAKNLTARPSVKDGVLNVSYQYLSENGEVPLSGTWQFYWEKLADARDPGRPLDLVVPHAWSGQNADANHVVHPVGYGLYRVLVRGLPPRTTYALSFGTTRTAYRVLVQAAEDDGSEIGLPTLVCSGGVVGVSRASSVPQLVQEWGTFSVPTEQFYVLVEMSNYEDKAGGLAETPLLGTVTAIKRSAAETAALDFFAMGVFAFMAFHYIIRFILRPTDRTSLFFGIFCVVLTFQVLITGRYLQQWVFPTPSVSTFVILSKCAFWTVSFLPAIFISFMSKVFPRLFAQSVVRSAWVLAVIAALFVAVTPLSLFARVMTYYEMGILVTGVYAIVGVGREVARRQPGAVISLVGFVLFFAAIVNDVLYSNEIIYTAYVLQYGFLAFMLSQSTLLSTAFHRALRYIEQMNESLNRFVPQEFISHLGKSSILDVSLGDAVTRKMTVMFSDIRSFTTLAERMSPDQSFRFLNSYLQRVGPVIRRNGGYIDKYIGDGFMALFPRNAHDAFKCGTELIRTVAQYNQHRASSGYDGIRIGVGVHFGELVLGTIGENQRIDGTVIADAVNLSSRLEGLNKTFGSLMIITDAIYSELSQSERAFCRRLGLTEVKGRTAPVNIYEVLIDGVTLGFEIKLRTRESFEAAVEHFVNGRFREARDAFEELAREAPDDVSVRYYTDRAAEGTRGTA